MLPSLPPNPSQEALELAYAAGLLRKEALQHGAYYSGRCRNASIARWHAGIHVVHWRTNSGSAISRQSAILLMSGSSMRSWR